MLSEKTFDLAFIMLGTNDLTDSEDRRVSSRHRPEEFGRCPCSGAAGERAVSSGMEEVWRFVPN